MIEVQHNNKIYHIQKEKLSKVLEKLNGSKVSENEFLNYMEKFYLMDEYFLDHVNKI